MTQGITAPQRARHSDHSLAVYLAPLIAGRRVGVVGPASGDVARRCRALGASTVVAFGGTGEGIAVRPLSPGQIESFHGRLDVIVVPDAAAVPLDRVLDEARKALGQDGVIAAAARPPAASSSLEPNDAGEVSYYDLHDAIAKRFEHVAMCGRGPFVAYTFARLEANDARVALDTRLIGDESPAAEAYVAIGSDHPAALDSITLVQVPAGEVLGATAPSAPSGRVEELEGKLKEVENASAERWVRVQRLEHELKTLDDDARKARDRAAKLAKDLDDERKLRQRTELESQMARRGQELPRVDPDELNRAREQAAQLERDVHAARGEATALADRVKGLERELDEAQGAEAALRGQLDAAEKARASVGNEEEFRRLESELHQRGTELIGLRQQLSDRDAAVRELAFSLEAAQQSDAGQQLQSARERVSELSALNVALASETSGILQQNELLRERLTQLEHESQARAQEASHATARIAELERALAGAARGPELDALRKELDEARGREALQETRRAEVERSLAETRRAVDEERARAADFLRQTGEARAELSRQLALLASIEDRATQLGQELEGARAGYARRTRELEREVEQLVQALEVVGTHSSDEDERLDALMRELDIVRAERNGIAFRMRDAEAALSAHTVALDATVQIPVASIGDDSEDRSERLLADLTETASRLASTEEALNAAREASAVAENRVAELQRALAESRSIAAAPEPVAGTDADTETLRREAADRELLVRSLVAQLEDRDLRLRAMERRLVEEVERARRTESEIWEVELRARDQRVAVLSRDLERARTDTPAGGNGGGESPDVSSLRDALLGREREIIALRTSIEQVRAGLSSILVDGRGAVVAHDLVNLLRQIEEPQES